MSFERKKKSSVFKQFYWDWNRSNTMLDNGVYKFGFQYIILLRLEQIYRYNSILQVGNNLILRKLYRRKLCISISIYKIGQQTRFL